MDGTTVSVEKIKSFVTDFSGSIDEVRSDVENATGNFEQLNEAFVNYHGYDGQLMEDRINEEVISGISGGTPDFSTIVYGYRANQTSGNDVGEIFANIEHTVNEINSDLQAIDKIVSQASTSATTLERKVAEVEDALSEGGASSVGGGSDVGYFDSHSGTRSLENVGAAVGEVASRLSGDQTDDTFTKYSSNSNGNNTSRTSSSSGNDVSSDYKDGFGKNSSSSDKNNSKNSNKDDDSTHHSGIGYDETSGFSNSKEYSSNTSKYGSNDDSGLDDAATSIDDILSGRKGKIPYSALPGYVGSVVTGSTVIPIASGLGATAATGAGLAAFVGRRKDDDDDDEEIELESNESPKVKMVDVLDEDNKKIISNIEELEEYGNGGDEDENSFSSSDIKSNQLNDIELAKHTTTYEEAKKAIAEEL